MSSEEEERENIAMVTGSHKIMIGSVGDDTPANVFINCVAQDRYSHSGKMFGMRYGDFVGDEAQVHRGIYSMQHPMKKGIIVNWDAMEQVWHHAIYNELRREPESQCMIMSNHLATPLSQKELTMQTMFETFGVPALFWISSGMSIMYSSGHTCGVAVDCGHGVTQITPFYEGRELRHAAVRLPFGGDDITTELQRHLNNSPSNITFTSSADREIVREIKEKISYVALNYELESAAEQSAVTYDLPGWEQISVGKERFHAPEVLFKPRLLGLDCRGIHQGIHDAIMRCDMDIRRDLWSNIIMGGGVSLTPRLGARLKEELLELAPARLKEAPTNIRIIEAPERAFSDWIGISIVGSLSNFSGAWLTKEQYDEGPPGHLVKSVFVCY